MGGAGGGSNDQREENIEIQKLCARKEGRKCPTPCPPKKKASVKEQGSVWGDAGVLGVGMEYDGDEV